MQDKILLGVLILAITTVGISSVYATGGGEVVELVLPDLEKAIQEIENGNVELGLEMLKEVNNQLNDTFFMEEDDD